MYKKKTTKKTYKKKARTSGWLSKYKPNYRAIQNSNVGLGRSLVTKLKTVFYANVQPAASGIFTGFLHPGSCFDPCGDIAAVQPCGFDQLALIYARYLVTGATVAIEFVDHSTSAATNAGFVCAAYPSTVSTALGTFQGAASQPYSQHGITSYTNGSPPVKFFFKLNTQKIVGSRLPVIAEDCGALVGASPATGQNIVVPIFIQRFTATGGTLITLKITIVQDVIFDQKIPNVDA